MHLIYAQMWLRHKETAICVQKYVSQSPTGDFFFPVEVVILC